MLEPMRYFVAIGFISWGFGRVLMECTLSILMPKSEWQCTSEKLIINGLIAADVIYHEYLINGCFLNISMTFWHSTSDHAQEISKFSLNNYTKRLYRKIDLFFYKYHQSLFSFALFSGVSLIRIIFKANVLSVYAKYPLIDSFAEVFVGQSYAPIDDLIYEPFTFYSLLRL